MSSYGFSLNMVISIRPWILFTPKFFHINILDHFSPLSLVILPLPDECSFLTKVYDLFEPPSNFLISTTDLRRIRIFLCFYFHF